jgi:hypothetical protein
MRVGTYYENVPQCQFGVPVPLQRLQTHGAGGLVHIGMPHTSLEYGFRWILRIVGWHA